jgi:hypothetical protein
MCTPRRLTLIGVLGAVAACGAAPTPRPAGLGGGGGSDAGTGGTTGGAGGAGRGGADGGSSDAMGGAGGSNADASPPGSDATADRSAASDGGTAGNTIDIYLIAGQSNATGQGYTKNLPSSFAVDTRVQIYHSADIISGAAPNTWIPLRHASEAPDAAGDRFGPELGFGNGIQAA